MRQHYWAIALTMMQCRYFCASLAALWGYFRGHLALERASLPTAAGIANVTIPFLGWGTGFMDYDNDGLVDIFVANGHVYHGVDQQDWGTTWAQRPLLFTMSRERNSTK